MAKRPLIFIILAFIFIDIHEVVLEYSLWVTWISKKMKANLGLDTMITFVMLSYEKYVANHDEYVA